MTPPHLFAPTHGLLLSPPSPPHNYTHKSKHKQSNSITVWLCTQRSLHCSIDLRKYNHLWFSYLWKLKVILLEAWKKKTDLCSHVYKYFFCNKETKNHHIVLNLVYRVSLMWEYLARIPSPRKLALSRDESTNHCWYMDIVPGGGVLPIMAYTGGYLSQASGI